jgi:aminocyclitol acetyltransferase
MWYHESFTQEEVNMKTRLEQVLERCLNGREIAVWGNPTRSMLRVLQPYKYQVADIVDPAKHYVVAVTHEDFDDFIKDEQFDGYKFIDDCTYAEEDGELPFEWECYGVKIGRWTYFGKGITEGCKNGYIDSIGQFTSINCSADIGVNHQLNITFTSDDIEHLFTDENKVQFRKLIHTDPQHPYALEKSKVIIGNDVYIGANAFINASKVTSIGDGAIIGSGSVVLEDVPPYAVVVGVPARIKRYRFSQEMIDTLLRIKWWNWSVEDINANFNLLISPTAFMAKFGNE